MKKTLKPPTPGYPCGPRPAPKPTDHWMVMIPSGTLRLASAIQRDVIDCIHLCSRVVRITDKEFRKLYTYGAEGPSPQPAWMQDPRQEGQS